MDDAVGVDVEGDLDLRHSRRRRQVDELELAQRLVVHRHLALALEHVDLDGWLHVLGRREDLGARVGIVVLRSIRRVITPPFVSMPSDSGVTSSGTSLTSPRSTPAWIAAPTATTSSGLTDLFGSLPVSLRQVLDRRHARRAADEDDVVQVALGDPGVGQRLLERNAAALDEVGGHLLELRAAERLVEVQRAVRRSGDEGQVDLRLLDLAELDLRLLGGLLEALDGHPVARQVDAVGGLELLHEESMTRWSQSSPPRCVSPWVDLTSNTPSPISSTETSNVPPPRSNTSTVSSCDALSRP